MLSFDLKKIVSIEARFRLKRMYRISYAIVSQVGRAILLLASFLAIFLIVYKFGFTLSFEYQEEIYGVYRGIVHLFAWSLFARFLFNYRQLRAEKGFWLEVFFLFVLVGLVLFGYWSQDLLAVEQHPWLYKIGRGLTYIVVLILSVIYFSKAFFVILKSQLRPEMLFTASFVGLILLGTFLLKLPMATYEPISYVDAFFTATSAVCVTGLTVLDTAGVFTPTGDVILLLLIQVGGIGVMTFTSFLAMSFLGKTSFRDLFALGNMLNETSINHIFRTLFYTVVTTLIIEGIGVYMVYLQIQDVPEISNKWFFAVFHAVSAFCNAGFSTLSGNLYDPLVRHLYGLQFWLALLVVFGGLGFPILFNYGRYFKYSIHHWFVRISHGKEKAHHRVHIVSTTTRVVLPTTLLLLVVGTLFFWIFEQNNTLAGLPFHGQMAVSFLGAVTPRTAGFNGVDMTAISSATIFLTIVLMWIGASPMSTGGGIKTTTFVIVWRNMIAILRGESRVELAHRQLTRENVNKAHAIMFLSLAWVTLAVMLLLMLEPQGSLEQIVFEVFSALGTVGLSLNFTPTLSDAGKVVVAITMFVGRVGLLTLLMGIVKRRTSKLYTYADDEVIL